LLTVHPVAAVLNSLDVGRRITVASIDRREAEAFLRHHRQRVSASPVVWSRKVKHRKMVNLDPRQIQTIKATVIKLNRIDDVDHMNKRSKVHRDRAMGSAPMTT
jgi:cytochrome c biogenesis factor